MTVRAVALLSLAATSVTSWRDPNSFLAYLTKHGMVKNPSALVSIFVNALIRLCKCSFVCLVKSCSVLFAPSNGEKNSSVTTCGTTVWFSCNECYDLEGYERLSCLPNETWSGEEPSCNC